MLHRKKFNSIALNSVLPLMRKNGNFPWIILLFKELRKLLLIFYKVSLFCLFSPPVMSTQIIIPKHNPYFIKISNMNFM